MHGWARARSKSTRSRRRRRRPTLPTRRLRQSQTHSLPRRRVSPQRRRKQRHSSSPRPSIKPMRRLCRSRSQSGRGRANRSAPPRVSPPRRRRRADGSHESNTPAATGTFGSEGLPPGVRSLPGAFARAIPPATGADPIWQSLPPGSQRPFTLAVEVDAQGHIASARILEAHDGSAIPPQFEHLRQRVIALLGAGLFALQNNGTAGARSIPDHDHALGSRGEGGEPARGAGGARFRAAARQCPWARLLYVGFGATFRSPSRSARRAAADEAPVIRTLGAAI